MGGFAARATAADGCPWLSWDSSKQGIVESNAAYFSALLPTNAAQGTTVQISGRFPKVRFFNFTIYHKGKLVDHLADANLYPVQGGHPGPYPAALPASNNYTNTYRITIRYEDAPADPAQRAPNTLYAGADDSQQDLLLLRLYLPNAGANETGDAGLPQLAQFNPDGSSSRFDNTTNLRCRTIAASTLLLHDLPLPIPYFPPRNPKFTVVSEAAYNGGPVSTARYANFDSGYAYSVVNTAKADLIIMRAKMPATPITPGRGNDPDVRYMSLCEYGQWQRKIVGCLPDENLKTQADGYFNVVLSQAEQKPVYADPAYGYNWMQALPPESSGILTLRQILAEPDFAGNYQVASAASNPISALGDWAPQITYCDAQTFANNALSGGAALFRACRNAYRWTK
jgi:hypothetical protein